MRVVVLSNMVPFVHGGAEELRDHLVRNLLLAGVEAEAFCLPFTWNPPSVLVEEMLIARHIRLWNVDRVIALKFPAYLVPFDNKVLWLMHQYRQAYDLRDSGQSNIPDDPDGLRVLNAVRTADAAAFSGARKVYTNSPTTSGRLRRYNGFDSTVLRPPLNDPELFVGGTDEGYILATGRVNAVKRQHLLVQALRHAPNARLVIAGPPDTPEDGTLLKHIAEQEGVSDRVHFQLRFLARSDVAKLVNGARAVAYLPYDEDSLGYCTMEAFQARKPMITAVDSGGVLDIVSNEVTGVVVAPNPEALGAAMSDLSANERRASSLGCAGHMALAMEKLNWPTTIERLLS